MSTEFRFKDLDISLKRNLFSGDINTLTDADAVKRSIKPLVMTNFFERPFQPECGSNVYFHLFENFTNFTFIALRRSIKQVINNFEPRAKNVIVQIKENTEDLNKLNVNIYFSINNIEDQYKISFKIERVR